MAESSDSKPVFAKPTVLSLLRGLAGGVLGGTLGLLLFRWLAGHGFYGLIIPGALLGLGAGLAAGKRNLALGVICALSAIFLSLFAEWMLFPFVKDKSFEFFLANVHQLRPPTLLMTALGAALAFWLGQGR
jgi:hypothetical protein